LVRAVKSINPEKEISIHAFTDGRDTAPKSGINYVKEVEKLCAGFKVTHLSTLVGRFYAMDRDKRWDRVQLAYESLVGEMDRKFSNASEAIEDAYANGETDEFVKPRQVVGGKRVGAKDQVLFFNFRADRAREISQAFGAESFDNFPTPVKIAPRNYVTFSEYQEDFPFPVIFRRERPKNVLGEMYASKGLKQLRVAETEKYAHVTYFFNGGEEEVFKNEDRVLVPSPKEVQTYDEKPEMSVFEVSKKIQEGMEKSYDLIVANFANGDMVGHTGVESAAIKAVEAMDKCMGELEKKAKEMEYDILITADHGNCEQMIDPESGEAFTQHTTNLVPMLWIGPQTKELKDGGLADIAPTVLKIAGMPIPPEMTGSPLF
ncbi:MAG: 2,3-bisphosphoglycerate-independent phosphoglycerate mutase, partial [Bdellovibrionales bacterium]|nr:2,3-bisphosphoglycerate-independent phosphoglycerate mutase [Bdellovibrionales bacterium]